MTDSNDKRTETPHIPKSIPRSFESKDHPNSNILLQIILGHRSRSNANVDVVAIEQDVLSITNATLTWLDPVARHPVLPVVA